MQQNANFIYDIAVVGGGIVGLASAYKSKTHPHLSIVVFEKEEQIAAIKQAGILELFILIVLYIWIIQGKKLCERS